MKIAGIAAALGLAAATALTGTAPLSAQAPAGSEAPGELKLWRLNCGEMHGLPLDIFSDTLDFAGETGKLVVSCYLIKHGESYMLWDTGLGTELIGTPPEEQGGQLVEMSIADQLAELGLSPADVDLVGISHWHGDHVGQAADFPSAKLLIGAEDLATIRDPGDNPMVESQRFAPWLDPASNAEGVVGDKDVFGDGSVVMLDMPGHTHGHHALLVRLPGKAPLLLSGDEFHFQGQMEVNGVPTFNADRADTLASHDRFRRVAENLGATIIIQHEPGDVGKLPAFPEAAE